MDKALFLDRDGVINVEKDYVYRVEDFEFMPGIFELCAAARALGFQLVVITNQAGIGRGYYGEDDFQALTGWMLERFRERSIDFARIYHCPHHPTAGVGDYRRESFDRKPNPGMILRAREELGLDLSRSVLLGDKDSDIGAGRAAGVRHLLKLANAREPGAAEDAVIVDSLEAVERWLRSQRGEGRTAAELTRARSSAVWSPRADPR